MAFKRHIHPAEIPPGLPVTSDLSAAHGYVTVPEDMKFDDLDIGWVANCTASEYHFSDQKTLTQFVNHLNVLLAHKLKSRNAED